MITFQGNPMTRIEQTHIVHGFAHSSFHKREYTAFWFTSGSVFYNISSKPVAQRCLKKSLKPYMLRYNSSANSNRTTKQHFIDFPDSPPNSIMHGAVWHVQAWQITHCLVTFQQWNNKHKVSLIIQLVYNVPERPPDEMITRYQSQLSRNHGIISFFCRLRWSQLTDALIKASHWIYSFF